MSSRAFQDDEWMRVWRFAEKQHAEKFQAQFGGEWFDPASLDTHSSLHPAKRHFVDVAYAGGQYVVQARQLDGSTGLASPVLRQDRTADRAFVARLVTRCIDQDFGARYELMPQLRVAAEFWTTHEFVGQDVSRNYYLGPSISVATQKLWFQIGAGFGLDAAQDQQMQIRSVLGFNL